MTEIPGRLRWLCRRGMLELDAWLQPFLENRYPLLDAPQQAAFARLLELEDFQIFDLLTGASPPPAELRCVIEQLRTHGDPQP
jgi:antitoxin CptB